MDDRSQGARSFIRRNHCAAHLHWRTFLWVLHRAHFEDTVRLVIQYGLHCRCPQEICSLWKVTMTRRIFVGAMPETIASHIIPVLQNKVRTIIVFHHHSRFISASTASFLGFAKSLDVILQRLTVPPDKNDAQNFELLKPHERFEICPREMLCLRQDLNRHWTSAEWFEWAGRQYQPK